MKEIKSILGQIGIVVSYAIIIIFSISFAVWTKNIAVICVVLVSWLLITNNAINEIYEKNKMKIQLDQKDETIKHMMINNIKPLKGDENL